MHFYQLSIINVIIWEGCAKKDSLSTIINLNVCFFPVAIPSVYKDWDEDDITG
jgi:hypothetical protein